MGRRTRGRASARAELALPGHGSALPCDDAGVPTLRTSVRPPYAAYLRVYEPLTAFPEPERSYWQDYAEQMLAVCNADPHLASLSSDHTYVPRPDFRPPTRFERRGERLGHGVWDLAYTKSETPSALHSEEAAANAVDDELHRQGGKNHAG